MPHSRIPKETSDRLARRVLFAFALTFISSRAVVFLIMSRQSAGCNRAASAVNLSPMN